MSSIVHAKVSGNTIHIRKRYSNDTFVFENSCEYPCSMSLCLWRVWSWVAFGWPRLRPDVYSAIESFTSVNWKRNTNAVYTSQMNSESYQHKWDIENKGFNISRQPTNFTAYFQNNNYCCLLSPLNFVWVVTVIT